jgi:glycosyltransferase involved in cell wall biosynthesis
VTTAERSDTRSVLLVVPWDQEVGGVASVVGNLGHHLETARHRAVFLHPGDSERPRRRATKLGFTGYEMHLRTPFIPEHPIRSVIAFAAALVPTLWHLAALIRSERVGIVNIHYPVSGFVYFALLRWLLPIRLVMSVHGADIFPIGQPEPEDSWPLHLMMRAADSIVAPSRAFLRDCLEVFPDVAAKSLAIHNGIDLDELLGVAAADPTAGAVPYLLCIAAHNEKKALDVLLRAFARIAPEQPRLRLLLVGDGPLRAQLEALARELHLDDRVEFLGMRGRAEVARLLRGCRIFVLPSRAEPFGMVVAEALASRRPVVATSVGGIAEIIEDGRSGLLVPPDDPEALARALTRVLGDDALGAALAECGYARAIANFGCESMGRRYEQLYADLLALDWPTPRHAATGGAR